MIGVPLVSQRHKRRPPNPRIADARRRATQAFRRAADRRRCTPGDPQRPMDRPDLGHRAGLRAGQPRHPAGRARVGLHAVLSAQSQALPPARGGQRRATRACRRSATTSTSAPTSAATRCFATANWSTSRPTSSKHWRDDLVIFALGCSFSFEDALMQDGIELRHITCGTHRADVSHQRADQGGGAVPRAAGGVDAAAQARRRHPRDPDHDAVSRRARRAGAYRQAGADRHQGHHEAGLRRSGADEGRRDSGVLGVRSDAAIGGRDGETGVLHHALSRAACW